MDKLTVIINDLPIEILRIIFKNLKVRDLIQCRLVCKQFMSVCDDIKIPELIISNQIQNIIDSWFAIKKQFNHEDAIDITTYAAWRSASTFRLENTVRRLHFKGSYSDYVQLKLYNLTELEQLKIDLEPCREKRYIDIKLLNLKILEIGNESQKHIFVVTAPHLEKLKCDRLGTTRIEDISSINHLEVNYFEPTHSNTLTNLQYLKVRSGDMPGSDILTAFPRLTTFFYSNCYHYQHQSIQSLRGIVEQKFILKRPELKIYFNSVEVVDIHKLNEFELVQVLEYQINNYNLLCDDAYSDHIDYNELMRLFQGQIPDDFFKKYSNTKYFIVMGKVESQEHLMGFLKRFDYLSRLSLFETSLNQRLYDSFHEFSNLNDLDMFDTLHSIINFDFLFKLKNLKTFRIKPASPEFFDIALALHERLKYFVSIQFYFNGLIEIRKNTQFISYRFAEYSFWRGLYVEDGLNFDRLVRMVNESKNTK